MLTDLASNLLGKQIGKWTVVKKLSGAAAQGGGGFSSGYRVQDGNGTVVRAGRRAIRSDFNDTEPRHAFGAEFSRSVCVVYADLIQGASNGVNVTVSHRFENHGRSGEVKRSGRRFGGSAGRLTDRGAEEQTG